MVMALSVTAVVVLLTLLCLLSPPEGRSMTRRAWARLALLAATGLSFVPGCAPRQQSAGTGTHRGDAAGDDALLRKWARLGKVWRDLIACKREADAGDARSEGELETLTKEMEAALDTLPAWPELRHIVEIQRERIYAEHYCPHTCYRMVARGENVFAASQQVEDRVRELEALATSGALSDSAVAKAAEVIALHAEYISRSEETVEAEDKDAGWQAWEKIDRAREKGELEAGATAELAGKRLVEMTLDDIGRLAGPPQPGEGGQVTIENREDAGKP